MDSSSTLSAARLTPEQKRKEREDNFINPPGIIFDSPEAEQVYRQRAHRLVDVYALRKPDRVPVALHFGSLPLSIMGVEYIVGMQDYRKAAQAFRSFNEQYAAALETYSNPGMVQPWNAMNMLDYEMYAWPGHGLPTGANNYQFVEGEYMKDNEYADLIRNPSDFWMRTYLPRIFGAFASFSTLDTLTDLMEIPTWSLMPLANPGIRATLIKLLAVGVELEKRNQIYQEFRFNGPAAGYPSATAYLGKAPFDVLGDTLRGTQGIMKDMYRHPEELLEAMEVIGDLMIKSVIKKAYQSKGLMVAFPLHKGADGWMSQKQFDKFYWPPLKKVIEAFINEGLIITLFAEGSYNSRLTSVNEFPKGAIHWWFDRSDIIQAKKVLGGRCSISGNVPSSLLLTGTPLEVIAHCRNLIEKCGADGGYMLSEGAADADFKMENLMAMVSCAKKYGVY
jgi:hypothetical protein